MSSWSTALSIWDFYKMRLGSSFCPNDTFMFYHLLQNESFDLTIADLETLNQHALMGDLDVVKVSCALYPQISDRYRLLSCGAALGFGVGPKVVSLKKEGMKKSVALPGKLTTANLLFDLFFPEEYRKVFCRFDEVERHVLQKEVDCGVIIHETRFTFHTKGLVEIADLGKLWEDKTHLPLPLGIIVAKKSLGEKKIVALESALQESILQAKENAEAAWPFICKHSLEKDPKIIQQHIDTYVTQESIALSLQGREAIDTLLEKTYV